MKICVECKKEFEHKGKQIYCSPDCRDTYWSKNKYKYHQRDAKIARENSSITCLHCKIEFKSYFYSGTRTKFCSPACKDEHHKKVKRDNNKSLHLGLKLQCKCCMKDFTPRRRVDETYCSKECKINYHSNLIKIEAENIRKQTVRCCPICNKQFTPKKTLKEIYCSPNCRKTIGRKIYKMMSTVYKQCNTTKKDHAHEVLGYSASDLLAHLQTFPQWETLKHGTWHLDHIFPIVAFIRKGIKDTSIICCLENLQPLSGGDNCSKSDDYDIIAFENWLKK